LADRRRRAPDLPNGGWLPLAAALLIAAAPAAAAQRSELTVAEFLARAQPLEQRSMATLVFSSEARRLAREIGGAAQALRAGQDAARRAGRTTPSCLPPKGKAKIDLREMMAHLRTIPEERRGMSFRAGFNGFISRKYPCPA
jgi:hypothetical protein